MPAAPKAATASAASETLQRRGFGADDRLRRRTEYERVLRGGRRRRSGPLEAAVCESSTGAPRLGLIIGKRAARRAVDRNRVRRHIRESFRHAKTSLPPYDIVVRLLHTPASAEDLRAALSGLWAALK